MKNMISCEFNIETACVERCLGDGSKISIDCAPAGAAVLVGGIIAGSVISNRKSKDDKR